MATFIVSQRGGEKLLYNGYSYSKHRAKDDKTVWRCERFQKPNLCRGRAESVLGNVTETQEHNHEPSPQKCEAAEISARIKETAATSTETAREVVTACLTGATDQAIVKMPKITSLQRGVRSLRHNRQHQEQDTLTARPENFIMGDSGPDDPERIIVLASRTDFRRLCSCSTWLADGTFKVAPGMFVQLWVIHGIVHNRVLPFLYCILPNKLEDAYLTSTPHFHRPVFSDDCI
ncbi:hypothetical protein QR680_012863 [Steinernema hermaphroditum]|uniref:FLYWCH-type domain-containing protein n=1 Tax=Steinernema hermaphroditum TaxID=289476 RepID=A0AA39I5L7_9BILA|nr:hypothetical protein QR680_012863 [Steinernema hermaphroditum]